MTLNYEEFIAELKALCDYHGFEIAGTCESEGIYGEITVVKVGNDPGWHRWNENTFNFVEACKQAVIGWVKL